LLLSVLFVLAGRSFFVWVFGLEFAAAYAPLIILLLGEFVNSAAGSVGFLLSMTGHERETMLGIAAAATLNIALNLLLTPSWGIGGAATAAASSMILWNVLLWWITWKQLGINSLAFVIGKLGPS